MAEPIPMIDQKIDRIAEEIASARTKALANSTIDPKTGAVKVASDSPELKRVSDLQSRSSRLAAIKAEIAGIFQAVGIESRQEIEERRRNAEGDLAGAPLEAFKHFKMLHELPKGNGGHPDLLPSDLVKAEAYQKVEREQRARMDRATADLEKINPVMARLHALISEANSL
mgnify:FL=1